MTSGSAKVFISYRREETAGHAGRLYDVMSHRFGESSVFMDVDIPPGVDFVERIKDVVGRCHVLLVVIGPRWATATAGSSLPRIFEPEDFVRLEVETGIRRQKITVIPVLVGGAKMPDPTSLPAPLRALTRRNAIELSDTRWRYDVDRLLAALDRLLAGTSAVHPRPQPAPAVPAQRPRPAPVVPAPVVPARRPAPVIPERAPVTPPAWEPPAARDREEPPNYGGALIALSATAVAAIAGVIARRAANGLRWDPDPGTEHFKQVVALGALTWAIVGAALAIWLAVWLRRQDTGIGALLLGALTGAVAGVVAGAGYWGPHDLLDNQPEADKLELYGVIGVALAGALIGALIGWIWRRRGSAGLAAGLVAGVVAGLILRHKHGGTGDDRVNHVLLQVILIVGTATFTQALLDAWEARSPRGRGALT